MKLIALCAATVIQMVKKKESPLTPELCKRIEYLSRVAVGESSSAMDGRQVIAEMLRDKVVSKLMADDCRRLKEFDGEPPPQAWLCKVVKRAAIDLYRQEHGRVNKSSMDELEKKVYELAVNYGYPHQEIRDLYLKLPEPVDISLDEIERIIEKYRPKPKIQSDPTSKIEAVRLYDKENDMTEDIFTDRGTPETVLTKGREVRDEQLSLEIFLKRLTPVQRLVISMFFGLGDQKYTMQEIVDVLFCLGIETSVTALQKQKDRAIEDFKEWLGKQKFSLEELIMQQVSRSAS